MRICPSCGEETPEGFPRCANCGAQLDAPAPGREQRKTVTVVFCDVTGSTAIDELRASPEPRSRAYGMVFEVEAWRSLEPSLVVARGERAAADAEAVFSGLGDERGLALVEEARYDIEWMQSRSRGAHAAVLAMREHARRAGDPVILRRALFREYAVLVFGDISASDALSEVERTREPSEDSVEIRAAVLALKGVALGLQGRFEEGRKLLGESTQLLAELGDRLMHGAYGHMSGTIALLAGDKRGAVRELRQSVRELEELGERGFRSTSLAFLAVALQAAGEPNEAERAALESEEISAPDDFVNFAMGRTARALVLADRAELSEAEELARSAVEYAFRTDFPLPRGDALAALSRVLRVTGREAEAEETLARAVELYESKGAGACVSRLHEVAGTAT